jgi:hypothetical protein
VSTLTDLFDNTFGCSHNKFCTSMSVIFISAPLRKCYRSGKIHLQQMPPGNQLPLCNNFLVSSVEDKVVFKGEGMLIYFPCNKGQY